MLRPLISALLLFSCLPAQGGSKEEREFPADWYWHSSADQWEKHAPLLGKPMPALDLGEWRNGDAKVLEQAAGKVLVLDFWATWCGPCIQSIPHNHELVEKYGKDGLVFVAICGSNRGQEEVDSVIKQHTITYPVARDMNQKSAEALVVQWWPTYAVVDRAGKVRAIGLRPDAVDGVVEKLLAEGPAGAATVKEVKEVVPPDPLAARARDEQWLEENPQRSKLLSKITGQPAPALQVTTWANGKAQKLGDFAGKVVMLDFWALWCEPCFDAIPRNNELLRKYGKQGLVVVGVCHSKGGAKMAEIAKKKGMKYATALDDKGDTIKAYGVDAYPDYYFIDKKGVLRVADCNADSVEKVIEALLAEK